MRRRKAKQQFASKVEATFVKHYGEEELLQFLAFDAEKLKLTVSESSANMVRAEKEMEANSEYQKAKAIVDDFRSALRDAKSHQDAKRRLALKRLNELGVVDTGDDGVGE